MTAFVNRRWHPDGTVVLTLDEPARRNPLSPSMVTDLITAFEELARDEGCRVVVVTGEGKGFCAGADLKQMGENDIMQDRAEYEQILQLNRLVWSYPKPTVAAVHGFALGGGCNLMSWCDFAIVEEGTRLGFPEVRSGMPVGAVVPMLQRTVGRRAMLEILLLGREIDLDRAVESGLINRVVPQGKGLAEALALAGDLAKLDSLALAISKETIAAVAEMDYERGVGLGRDLRVIAVANPETPEERRARADQAIRRHLGGEQG